MVAAHTAKTAMVAAHTAKMGLLFDLNPAIKGGVILIYNC